MTNRIAIDVLPVSLIVLFLIGMRIEKPLSALNTGGYLSLETGKYYRGIFAIVIVLHHLAQRTETGIMFRYFIEVGYLAVAFFFFLSGYGLQKSFIEKQSNYQKGFLLKRIPSVLIPYIIITFFYWLAYLLNGQLYSLKDIIISIIDGYPLVTNSWYIINILVFYVVYWLLMLVCKKRYLIMVLGGIAWYILYVCFCMKMGYGSWWYSASHLLIAGMFWATYESKILDLLRKYYFIIAPVVWTIFLFLFLQGKIAGLTLIPSIVSMMLSSMFFVFSVVMFSLKIHIGNKILYILGDISLEIYISQGLIMPSLRNSHIYIKNELLWCIAVLAGTIIFSYLLHIIFQMIFKKYRLLLRKLNV